MAQVPLAIGLTLCETVITDAATHNRSYINCFARRSVAAVPSAPLTFYVCATLTDGNGAMPLTVRIVEFGAIDAVYQYTTQVQFSSPLAEVRLRLHVDEVVFPSDGGYDVLLDVGGEIIAQRRLQIAVSGG